MTVSGIIDKAASQEMAVSLNQGISQNQVDRTSKTDLDRLQQVKSAEELSASELMEKAPNKLAVDILKPFLAKLSQAGITPQAANNLKVQSELEKLLGQGDLLEDRVEIKGDTPILAEVKRLKEREEGKQFKGSNQEELMALLKEFAQVASEYAATHNPDLAARLQELKQKLKQQGLSEEKIAQLEAKVKNGSQINLDEAVKENIILQLLSSDSRLEKLMHNRGLTAMLSRLEEEEISSVLGRAKEQAIDDIKGFVLEELENQLIKKTYLQDTDFKDVMKLLNLADKSGVDYKAWLEEVWPKKKEDHGLYLMDVPHSVTGLTVNCSTDDPGQKQKHGYEYEGSDEKEVLINRLRALYLQRSIKGDAWTNLETVFKMRKLKNGLFRLGIFTPELDEQIKHEAEVLAKMKTLEMLNEALLERATFYDLAGPAHELVEKKMKGLIKNLERLGMPLSNTEFIALRDKANYQIFELSKKELEVTRGRRKQKDSDKLAKKEKHLLKLLARLARESDITDASFLAVETNI